MSDSTSGVVAADRVGSGSTNKEPASDCLSHSHASFDCPDGWSHGPLRGVGAVPADEPTGRTDEQIRADLAELDEPHLALDKAETYDRLLNDVEPLLARAVAAERRLAAACIHHYENDQHYDHEGPHELPSWREVVQLRARLAAAELINEQLLVGDVDLSHSLTDIISAIANECLANRGRLAAVTEAAKHPHKGEVATDASMLLEAAKRIEDGYLAGGQHTKATVGRVLRAVATSLLGVPGE